MTDGHWVTIDGNHVLLGDEGESLNDKSFLKNGNDSFMSKEEMDTMFREAAEAMNQGISIKDLRAKKLSIDADELDAIEEMMPSFQKMSAENIKHLLHGWWLEQADEHFLNLTPTLKMLAEEYGREIHKKHSFEKGLFWPFSPLKALLHYMKGKGKTLTVDINDIDIKGEDIAKSKYVKDFLQRNPEASIIPLHNQKFSISLTDYPEEKFLGDISIRASGVLYKRKAKFYFKGQVKAFNDWYDFNLTDADNTIHRDSEAQAWTVLGSKLKGQPYQIKIEGMKHLDELSNKK